MHNRNWVVWFGMLLGASSLLGCPPAAKDAKDAKQEEASGEPTGDANEAADEKEEKQSDSPKPGGGW